MKIDLVVTRHHGLIDVLRELGYCNADTPVIPHATIADVRGKNVAGVLPLSLAAECNSVIEVALNLPQEARGRELNRDEVLRYMTAINRYELRVTDHIPVRRGYENV